MARLLSTGCLWIIALAFGSQALCQEPSGTAVKVDQNAAANGPGGSRILLTQGAIHSEDDIRTDQRGNAQIIFVDDTRFVVGPNSHVRIDKFVFNPNRTAQSLVLTATKGSFRFISGASASRAYQIRTPAMVIGVRGTAFDFTVEAGTGRVTEALYSGRIVNCAEGACVEFDAACAIIVALPGTPAASADAAGRAEALAYRLPFAGSGQSLLEPFRVNTSSCEAGPVQLPPRFQEPSDRTGDSEPRDRPSRGDTDNDF